VRRLKGSLIAAVSDHLRHQIDERDQTAGPSRSGFLSAFFTLVGMHGVHVTSGLIALVYLVAQVIANGLRAAMLRRLLCWSLFWHALDIVWVGVFTLVYLMGD